MELMFQCQRKRRIFIPFAFVAQSCVFLSSPNLAFVRGPVVLLFHPSSLFLFSVFLEPIFFCSVTTPIVLFHPSMNLEDFCLFTKKEEINSLWFAFQNLVEIFMAWV